MTRWTSVHHALSFTSEPSKHQCHYSIDCDPDVPAHGGSSILLAGILQEKAIFDREILRSWWVVTVLDSRTFQSSSTEAAAPDLLECEWRTGSGWFMRPSMRTWEAEESFDTNQVANRRSRNASNTLYPNSASKVSTTPSPERRVHNSVGVQIPEAGCTYQPVGASVHEKDRRKSWALTWNPRVLCGSRSTTRTP